MLKRKRYADHTFQKEFVQLCERHKMIKKSKDVGEKVFCVHTNRNNSRTSYDNYKIHLNGSSIELTINNSYVSEIIFPVSVNELILKYVGKPIAYMLLSTLLHKEDQHMWVGESFMLDLERQSKVLRSKFYQKAPLEDLLLLKKDPVNRQFVLRTLGFRGELDILKSKLNIRKWNKVIYKNIIKGYYKRKDLKGLQTFLDQVKQELPDFLYERFETNIVSYIISGSFFEKEDFDIIEPYFRIIVETIKPLERIEQEDILNTFCDEDDLTVAKIKQIIDYHDEE